MINAKCGVMKSLHFQEFCSREASQILGGRSYLRGNHIGGRIERCWREAGPAVRNTSCWQMPMTLGGPQVRVFAIGGGSNLPRWALGHGEATVGHGWSW